MSAVVNHVHAALADPLHAPFVAALPTILNVARYHFRRVPCPDRREDCVCETVALCWVWYVRLVRKGRNPETFMSALARYACSAVHSGRRACGMERAKDVLSRRCQRRREFTVSTLPRERSEIAEALRDNTQTPVPRQVQFRIDFPAWKERFPAKKQQLIERLALGHRTKDVAVELGLTEGRISQLRKEFCDDYAKFCSGEDGE